MVKKVLIVLATAILAVCTVAAADKHGEDDAAAAGSKSLRRGGGNPPKLRRNKVKPEKVLDRRRSRRAQKVKPEKDLTPWTWGSSSTPASKGEESMGVKEEDLKALEALGENPEDAER